MRPGPVTLAALRAQEPAADRQSSSTILAISIPPCPRRSAAHSYRYWGALYCAQRLLLRARTAFCFGQTRTHPSARTPFTVAPTLPTAGTHARSAGHVPERSFGSRRHRAPTSAARPESHSALREQHFCAGPADPTHGPAGRSGAHSTARTTMARCYRTAPWAVVCAWFGAVRSARAQMLGRRSDMQARPNTSAARAARRRAFSERLRMCSAR